MEAVAVAAVDLPDVAASEYANLYAGALGAGDAGETVAAAVVAASVSVIMLF
jgi:hypothetical protein